MTNKDILKILDEIKHLMPVQQPLKEFVHHNTLHMFQDMEFHAAQRKARRLFRTRNYLSFEEYCDCIGTSRIDWDELLVIIQEKKWTEEEKNQVRQILESRRESEVLINKSSIRGLWSEIYKIDVVSHVQPMLFRLLASFLDQGIAVFKMPHTDGSFWQAIKNIESESCISLFRSKRKDILRILDLDPIDVILFCLDKIVGNSKFYSQYLLEMCLEHPGWSGMVGVIEDHPRSLNYKREIKFVEVVALELVFELDFAWSEIKKGFAPLCMYYNPSPLSEEVTVHELVLEALQEAYEWTYFRQALAMLIQRELPLNLKIPSPPLVKYQVMTCIDDRSCSLRRHLEDLSERIETFGTAGFFGLEFYYQEGGTRWPSKLCPPTIQPDVLIKENLNTKKNKFDPLLAGTSQTFFGGWISSYLLGVWSGIRLVMSVFNPKINTATSSSLIHSSESSEFKYLKTSDVRENGLQVGFQHYEMAERIARTLKSIGIKEFSPIVLILGHGSTTTNNPHFAAYNCGACSGRPGSINARLFATMANLPEVRELLKDQGVEIPMGTTFISGIHDTTRDEVKFFVPTGVSKEVSSYIKELHSLFLKALERNAKERTKRFDSISSEVSAEKAHLHVVQRSVSICETRPELNHASNCMAIIGRRQLTKNIFLDRRAFLNSYDPYKDGNGEILSQILSAVIPVCGGINLEYYFSRVDNQFFGAGTKLPHNVVGLIGVSNGTEGDLKTGLPYQMIDLHEPMRLMVVVEQTPEIIKRALSQVPQISNWVNNNWIHLISLHPESKKIQIFRETTFSPIDIENRTESLKIFFENKGGCLIEEVEAQYLRKRL